MHVFFSCATNQSSQGYCNNYQKKHDDACPTTESNKPRTMQEVFDASCNSYALPCDWPDASPV